MWVYVMMLTLVFLKDAQENEDRIMLKEKSKGSGTNKKTD
jgi:hypothetical protein